jgi:hypothetical protein
LKVEKKNIFQRINDEILEFLVNLAVFFHNLVGRKKKMDYSEQEQNGKNEPKDKGQQRVGKISLAPSSHEVKFADFAQIVLTPTHGIIKFGVHQTGTDEFVVHSQIAMPPQALVMFAEGLKKQIEMIKDQQSKQPPRMEP